MMLGGCSVCAEKISAGGIVLVMWECANRGCERFQKREEMSSFSMSVCREEQDMRHSERSSS